MPVVLCECKCGQRSWFTGTIEETIQLTSCHRCGRRPEKRDITADELRVERSLAGSMRK